MTDRTLSLRVTEALNSALEELAHEYRTSKSEVARDNLRQAVLHSDGAVPEHLVEQVERERRIERNKLDWQRIHFPSNVAGKFTRAFEQGDLGVDGLGEQAVEDLREIYVEEAEALFGDDDRQESAVEYVEALADHAAASADASEFNRLDPAAMFERYQGVADGREAQALAEERETVEQLMHQGVDGASIVDRLTQQYDLSIPEAQALYQEVDGDE